MSDYSGAATIFGATGGVMEAALRTAYELKTGQRLDQVEFQPVRGLEGIKEAEIQVGGLPVRVAVAHGLSNARTLLDKVAAAKKNGGSPYHFIEIMACRGGCIGGGGQPIDNSMRRREERIRGLYREDLDRSVRRSHENPEIKAIYEAYLGAPGGETSHHLLHTHYTRRDPYASAG
jgi:iron only hydrogenase large subunit-like protein